MKILTALSFVTFLIIVLKLLYDRMRCFEKYLIPDLEKNGFQFISSSYFNRFLNSSFNDLDEDWAINPLGGSTTIRYVHRKLRKVQFKNIDGKQFEAIAAIEFKGIMAFDFKRVRWIPSLELIDTGIQ